MYTQCPQCSAVYRITSTQLRAASGEVRCGSCGARFDALDRLADTFPEAFADGEDTPRESVARPSGDHEETEDMGPADRDAAETEGTQEQEIQEADSPPVDASAEPDSDDSDDEPTVDLDMTAEEIFALSEVEDQELPGVDDLEFVEGLPPEEPHAIRAQEPSPPTELVAASPSELQRWLQRLAVPLLAVLLLGLAVHSQRGVLMRSTFFGPVLEGLYGLVGVEVMPAWDLSAYRIIESAAAIDQNGDLQVSLDFVNEADFDQPYPILRVSLEDRWGDEIGSREVPPSEYMGPDLEGRMLGSDRRARGEAALADPVPEAVGFRLDLCLPDTEGKLRCLSNQP
ncbi:MAG: DUF3426 domain-containing protein [Gammaproteobacteria bacterium]